MALNFSVSRFVRACGVVGVDGAGLSEHAVACDLLDLGLGDMGQNELEGELLRAINRLVDAQYRKEVAGKRCGYSSDQLAAMKVPFVERMGALRSAYREHQLGRAIREARESLPTGWAEELALLGCK